MREGMALHQKRRKCLYDKYLSISNAHDKVLKKKLEWRCRITLGGKEV